MELNTNIFVPAYDKIIEIHKSFSPFPDVLEALHALKNKGYELAVMSNSTKQIMQCNLEKLDNIFDDSLVADETECYKPDLNFFRMAEQKFSLHEKEHCHIAKGYWWDIVPATKMGWKKIWVNRLNLTSGRSVENPYITVSSLKDLPQLNGPLPR